MAELIRVGVTGAAGRMGREVLKAVAGDPGMKLVFAVDRAQVGATVGELVPGVPKDGDVVVSEKLSEALTSHPADVLVDFSNHAVILENALTAIKAGCSPVIGATGLSKEAIDEIASTAQSAGVPALLIPNFAIGAVLMMKFSELASKWYPDAEIIELHHEKKEDAPSGTALLTAELIGKARVGSPSPKPNAIVKAEGALGGNWHGVPVHSIRLPGLLAHQQVMFGAQGETLTIRHDSSDRAGFMHGVKLAIREVKSVTGLVIGLDRLLFRDGI